MELVFTAQQSWAETNLDQESLSGGKSKFDEGQDTQGPISLAVAAENFQSKARVVAFGDSDFPLDVNFFAYANGDLMVNSIDWAAGQEAIDQPDAERDQDSDDVAATERHDEFDLARYGDRHTGFGVGGRDLGLGPAATESVGTMIRRSTLVLLVVFAALVAGAIFWQRSQDKKSPSEATATPGSQLLFDFKGNITGLRLERTSGGMLELGRDAQGTWTLIYPKAEATDISAVQGAVSQLISMSVLSTLEEGPTMEAAGLATPAYRLLISLDDGSQVVMNVGNVTPTGAGYYVLVSQQGMSIVSKYSLEPFLKLLDNPPVMLPATPTAGDQNMPGVILTPAP